MLVDAVAVTMVVKAGVDVGVLVEGTYLLDSTLQLC